jgi:phage terminase large subunit-like protein
MYDIKKADKAVKFFENLKHTKGKFHGQPFTLLDWESKIIRDVYGTLNDRGIRQYQHVYVEIPKKNGKSELAAGAGLYHLFADGEIMGEVYGCAAEREQASIVFDVAVEMIDQVPALKKRAKLNLSKKRITDKITGTYYQVLSSESFTKHGFNASAVIFDELHAQPNRALYDVMTFGAGDAREQPIWWVITTAGDDPDRVSIGWEKHEYAAKILAGDVVDPLWYPVIFNYDGDDIYNPENWEKANPSLGHTFPIEKVQDAANTAMQSKADERLFRWLRLNQWTTTKLTNWLPVDLFDETTGTWSRKDLIGRDCYVGLDLSSTTDLTATALVFPPQGDQLDWRIAWDCWIPEIGMQERIKSDRVPYDLWKRDGWITATEGDVVDYNKVEERILEYKKLFNVQEIPADRSFATMLLQRLETAGMLCVDIPQTYAVLTDPMNMVEVLLKNQKLTHEPNPVARWCFGNTSVAKNGNAQINYVKEHKGRSVVRTKRIDLIAALVIAMARAKFYVSKVDLSAAILSDDWGM